MSSEQQQNAEQVPWYRVAFTKRWLSYLLITAIFAGACIALSTWQFARRDEARQEIDRVLANYNSEPEALNIVLPDPQQFNPDDKWIPVEVTGKYLVDEQFVVRSRPREQVAGVEVLSPLLTDEGTIFIVDRGWLPANENPEDPYVLPSPPTGEVTVIARLKASEPSIPGREMSDGQVATIELPLIEEILGAPTYTGAYGLLARETPSASDTAPLPALKPTLEEGAHLSYALQWIMFGVLAFIGLVWAVRNELRIRNAETEEGQAKRAAQASKRRAKPTEEDIEDAILDGR
ncbi:cytochrome oxidase assembly protein ShyY1 [Aurantimicrobium minutum]|uniref:SURF1 family cytochrome oxidase biogenesis protein n=1 Tax=Aurantimicrobium minutum TaxID=708131 RepID=UPI002475DF82|nr:SURF1 family protein [Aurantimicrobium minutum]MDH6278415.1 cytochrome oxidase assembly protein ShyY1 [Aurantimicrobium minutum]